MSDSATRRERPAAMPITSRLNATLVILVFFLALGLLWLGSHVPSWPYTLLVGVAFSYVLLTNYALLHEAEHDHRDPPRASSPQSHGS
jgi:fatty acid desaturase